MPLIVEFDSNPGRTLIALMKAHGGRIIGQEEDFFINKGVTILSRNPNSIGLAYVSKVLGENENCVLIVRPAAYPEVSFTIFARKREEIYVAHGAEDVSWKVVQTPTPEAMQLIDPKTLPHWKHPYRLNNIQPLMDNLAELANSGSQEANEVQLCEMLGISTLDL